MYVYLYLYKYIYIYISIYLSICLSIYLSYCLLVIVNWEGLWFEPFLSKFRICLWAKRRLKMFPDPGYLYSESWTVWLLSFLVIWDIYIYIYIHIYTYICECVCVVWKYSLNRYLVKGCWWLFLYFRVLVNTYADTLEVNMTNYPQNITRKPVSLRTGGTTTEKNVCS